MAEFSTQLAPDEVCVPCQRGNKFLCQMPQEMQDKLQLRGFVNGKDTLILPVGEVHTLINNKEESINKVELMIGGEKKTLIKDLSEFGELKQPEEIKVFIGANEPKPPQQHRNRTEYAMQTTAQQGTGVFGFELNNLAGLSNGSTNVKNISSEQKAIIGSQLSIIFGIDWERVNDIYSSTASGILKEIINLAANYIDSNSSAAAAASSTGMHSMSILMARQLATFEVLVMSSSITIQKIQGKFIFCFKSQIRYAKFVVTELFPVGGIVNIDTRMQTQTSNSAMLKSTAGGVFKGTGGVFLFIGAGLSVAEYFAKEESERFLSDLFTDLAVMIATAVLSAIIVMAGIILLDLGAMVASGGIVIVAVIAGVTFLIGMAINGLWSLVDDKVKKSIRNFISSSNQFLTDSWRHRVEQTAEELYSHTNHHLPGGDLQLLDLLMRAFGSRGISTNIFSR